MPVIIPSAVGLAATGYNLYNSYQEKKAAQKQLDELRNTPMEQYGATPELTSFYNRAVNDSYNPQGLSPAEIAAYKSNVSGNINTGYRNAVNTSGGNLSKYLSSAFNPAIVNSSNQLVAQDQGIKRANRMSALGRIGQGVGYFQGIQGQNTTARNRRQELIAQALGGGIAQQNQNIAGGVNNVANAGFYLAGQGYGGGAKTSDPYLKQYMGQNLNSGLSNATNGVDPNYLPPELLY